MLAAAAGKGIPCARGIEAAPSNLSDSTKQQIPIACRGDGKAGILPVEANSSHILIYQPEDGKTRIDVRLEEESVWLTQGQMAELFQSSKQNISAHIRNIYEESELDEAATVKEYLTVQTEGGDSACRPPAPTPTRTIPHAQTH